MAEGDTKISDLTARATPAGADEFPVISGGVNYRTPLSGVQTYLGLDTRGVSALGIITDGVTPGQEAALVALKTAAIANRYVLTGYGSVLCYKTLDLERAPWVSPQLRLLAGIHLDTGSVGDFRPDGASPPVGVTDVTIEEFVDDNTTSPKVVGLLVKSAGNGTNSDKLEQTFDLRGDGNDMGTRRPTVCLAQHGADDSGLATYRYYLEYGWLGLLIVGPAEKHVVEAKVIYCEEGIYVGSAASADTLEVKLNGNNCKSIYRETNGTDTSVHLWGFYEQRVDPSPVAIVTFTAATNLVNWVGHPFVAGNRVMFRSTGGTLAAPLSASTNYYIISSGITPDAFKVSLTLGGAEVDLTTVGTGQQEAFAQGTSLKPALHIRNQKKTSLGPLQLRGLNGRRQIVIHRSGSNAGVDAVVINNVEILNTQGIQLAALRGRKVDGTGLVIDHCRNSQAAVDTNGGISSPAVVIGQIQQWTLPVSIHHCYNDYGIQIGDDVSGLYPRHATFGPFSIHMENTTSWGNTGLANNSWPTTLTAVHMYKCDYVTVDVKECWGNIVIAADCTNSTLILPANWLQTGATLTKHASATLSLKFEGPVLSTDLFAKSWLFRGVSAFFSDLGQWAWYNGTQWVYAGRAPYLAANWFPLYEGIAAGSAWGTANLAKFYPYQLKRVATMSDLMLKVVTNEVGKNAQMAIYANNPATNKLTGSELAKTGNMSIASLGVGAADIVGANVTLYPGTYWIGVNCDSTIAVFQAPEVLGASTADTVGSPSAANLMGGTNTTGVFYSTPLTLGTWGDLTAAALSQFSGASLAAVGFKAA